MRRIEILKEAHELLKSHHAYGICNAISEVLYKSNIVYHRDPDLNKYFPLFTFENAKKVSLSLRLLSNTVCINGFWWPYYRYGLLSGRRRFMRWLCRQYKHDNTEV